MNLLTQCNTPKLFLYYVKSKIKGWFVEAPVDFILLFSVTAQHTWNSNLLNINLGIF